MIIKFLGIITTTLLLVACRAPISEESHVKLALELVQQEFPNARVIKSTTETGELETRIFIPGVTSCSYGDFAGCVDDPNLSDGIIDCGEFVTEVSICRDDNGEIIPNPNN